MRHAPVIVILILLVPAGAAMQPARPLDPIAHVTALFDDPAVRAGVLPFAEYIVSRSTLAVRDRELLVLRAAAVTGSGYLWTAPASTETRDILLDGNPTRRPTTAFEAALVRAADELHWKSFVLDRTFTSLRVNYGDAQLVDAVLTAGGAMMFATIANTLAQMDARFRAADPPVSTTIAWRQRVLGRRAHTPPAAPRFLPPGGVRAGVQLSDYIRQNSSLTPRVREMLALRMAYLCGPAVGGSAYDRAAHTRAARAAGLTAAELERLEKGGDAGWPPADAAIVRAAEEIHGQDRVSPETWKQLSVRLTPRQLLDLMITAGGYRLMAMAANTLGVPLEGGDQITAR